MGFPLKNLLGGIKYRTRKMFHRPFRVFDIGWLEEKRLKHQADTSIKQHLYKGKYNIYFRDAPEFMVSIQELFIDELYKFKPETTRPKIIDCGSYIGTSILYFKTNYPQATVTGFEPDATNYSLLSRNLEGWGFQDIQVVNAAIWINNDGITFNSAGNMSSKIEAGGNDAADMKKVKTVRLNELLNEPVDFLKIDIEGAELPVLKDCSDKLKNVKNLFVEYHGKFEKPSELNDILDILLKNNFKYCVREGNVSHPRPFWDKDEKFEHDMLLNIFAFRD